MSSSTDIDADVMEKADFLVALINLESDRERQVKGAARVIQAARNEERERCAKKAESTIRDGDNEEEIGGEDWVWRVAGNGRAEVIAAAIREGK